MSEFQTPISDQHDHPVDQGDVSSTRERIVDFPYDTITAEDIKGITEAYIRECNEQVEKLVATDVPTWADVHDVLEDPDTQVTRDSTHVMFMSAVHPDKVVRDAATDAETEVDHYGNDVWYREDLYEKFKQFAATPEAAALQGEEARSLAKTMRMLHNLGHDLDPAQRAHMQEINRKLGDDSTEFDKNLREDTTKVVLTLDELDGMSEDYISGLDKDEAGNYIITMQYPHRIPLMAHATNRQARQKVSVVASSRLKKENRPILEDAVRLRQEFAGLLGYPSWAHYKLESRMAKTPETVKEFYAELIDPLTEKATAEIAVMTDMLHADGYNGLLRKYDRPYYSEKLRQREHGVDQEKIAEYFSLDSVLAGMLDITSETFGVEYRQLEVKAWHDDVKTFAIYDKESGDQIATFHMDLFPRDGKYGHAAAFTLQSGRELPDGTYRKPESAIVANFTKPTADKPSLLTHDEVNTLFHEFGHILHQTLTRARMSQFSGSRVERDFVEALSQIMEHWVEDPEILNRFARHYQTGEPLPPELLEGLVASQKLNIGLANLGQMSLGYLDMALHDETPVKDLDAISEASSAISLLPHEEGAFIAASFGHLMSGYDAGYYGYMWSEVIGDDMFGRFKREGLTNPAVGMDFRRMVQERGGTVDAEEMIRDFLGREPNNEEFLENNQITVAKS